jgi:long-chain acyl-CoA synthetase
MKLEDIRDRCTTHDEAIVVEITSTGARREITHSALGRLAEERARGLVASGVRPGHVIGIRAKNSFDWIAWDLAAMLSGAVLQAFPDETADGGPARVIEQHELALLVTDTAPVPPLPSVVAAEAMPDHAVVAPTARQHVLDDQHSLVYSSGTSGALKGLRISRKGTEHVITRFIESFGATPSDRHLIFLPLWNYQQRLSVYCCLWLGADLVLAPYQRVFSAAQTERPTFLIAPPVFYDTVIQLHAKSRGETSLNEFLGGRIRFLITGMAPIRRRTLDAFWAADVRLLEAYGMTESGMIAWNTPDAFRVGTVGKLIDPDAIRFASDGEVLIRRPAPLSIGYFEADADTARETFRPDGTIASGDYGRLDEDGFLTLLGRKNDVIVLGSGRKVNPAEIEALFRGVSGVTELVVVPAPRSGLGAIITPADSASRDSIARQVAEVNQTLEAHHRITATLFITEPLQTDRRFMTGNMKLSRSAAAAYFAENATVGQQATSVPVSDRSGQ